jgi:hypothetical protein
LQELDYIKGSIGYIPWLLAGDFNVIRFQQEKWVNIVFTCYETEFVECINRLEVEDLAFMGCFHTWTNKQVGESFVSKELDRVMSNLEWMLTFGISVEQFLSFGPKPFNFLNFLVDHKLFLDWIAEGWSFDVDGYSMYKLYAKLKAIKRILKVKNIEVFGGLG